MSARVLISAVLRNTNRSFGNSAPCYGIFHHGESSVLFVDSDSSQGLHLSSLVASKIPEPPKSPLSPFTAYLMKRREDFLKVQPVLKLKDIMKQVAVDWSALSVEEKKPYMERSETERAKFKALKEKWWSNLTAKQKVEYNDSKQEMKRIKEQKALKKTLRLLGKPKRPGNAFTIFVSQINRNLIKSGQNLFDYAAETWKSMSDVDKQPFINMATTGQERYKKELLAWESKMLKEGNEELVHHKAKIEKHTESTDHKSLDSTGKMN